jgi:hypothetical protein
MYHKRPVVRKRTTVAIGIFATISFDSHFDRLFFTLATELKNAYKDNDTDKLQSFLTTIAVLCRTSPSKMKSDFAELLELTFTLSKKRMMISKKLAYKLLMHF